MHWIARDEDYHLFIYREKPVHVKNEEEPGYFCPRIRMPNQCWHIDNSLYPEVTYENSPQILTPTKPEQS